MKTDSAFMGEEKSKLFIAPKISAKANKTLSDFGSHLLNQ